LIDEVRFIDETLWIKDFYLSRIREKLKKDPEGQIVVRPTNPAVEGSIQDSTVSPEILRPSKNMNEIASINKHSSSKIDIDHDDHIESP
jgi:hypothetical protein